jgi:hypothetical protein
MAYHLLKKFKKCYYKIYVSNIYIKKKKNKKKTVIIQCPAQSEQ